jgi:hypothetical protein
VKPTNNAGSRYTSQPARSTVQNTNSRAQVGQSNAVASQGKGQPSLKPAKQAKTNFSQVEIKNALAKFSDADQLSKESLGHIDIQNFPDDVQEMILEHLRQNQEQNNI